MYSLVILAAGSGKRMGLGYNKLLYKHNEKEIILYTLEKFLKFKDFSEIIITINESEIPFFTKILPDDERIKIIMGGENRASSVKNAIEKIENEYVFIHDGARCFIDAKDIELLLNTIETKKCYCSYKNVIDTIHYGENGKLLKKLERSNLYAMQTPQVFNSKLLKQIYNKVTDFDLITDEVGLFLDNKIEVGLVQLENYNEKFTKKEDMRSLNEL